MIEVATALAVIGLAIGLGYVIRRIDLLGEHATYVLSRLAFFVLSPFLLFVVLSQADVGTLFSALLPVSAIAAVAVILLHAAIARWAFRRSVGETLIGALSAGQVNSNNIGIPLSLYLLGSAAFPAPVILMQLVLFTPITLAVLDSVSSGTRALGPVLRRTARNPILLGSLAGALVSILGIDIPPIVLDPMQLIANAYVPIILITYGMSLYGQRVLGTRGHRRDILLATFLKLAVMPVIAWAVGTYLFQMSAGDVLIVTVLAALPSAQNVFNYAQRYGIGLTISRDTILLTTVGCIPVLLLIMFLLG